MCDEAWSKNSQQFMKSPVTIHSFKVAYNHSAKIQKTSSFYWQKMTKCHLSLPAFVLVFGKLVLSVCFALSSSKNVLMEIYAGLYNTFSLQRLNYQQKCLWKQIKQKNYISVWVFQDYIEVSVVFGSHEIRHTYLPPTSPPLMRIWHIWPITHSDLKIHNNLLCLFWNSGLLLAKSGLI